MNSLVEEANELLRAGGSADLVEDAFTYRAQIFDPAQGYGENLRATPNGRIYEPKGDKRQAKTRGIACPQCGNPQSKFARFNSICRTCYTKNARAKQEKAITQKYEKIDEHLAKYSWLLAHYVDIWLQFERKTPNFADRLIEDISRWEEYVGLPFIYWTGELEFDSNGYEWEPPEKEWVKTDGWRRAAPFKNDHWARKLQSAWRYFQ